MGLRQLRAYRKEWDESRGVWKDRPRHDEASHGADAFPTFACSGYTHPHRSRQGGGILLEGDDSRRSGGTACRADETHFGLRASLPARPEATGSILIRRR